jgi:hypothetical protein
MARASEQSAPSGTELAPPPDIFDAQALDLEFWLRPRTIEVVRPASKERAKLLYWKDGEIIESAYQDLCHLMRDVNGGNETAPSIPSCLKRCGARRLSCPLRHRFAAGNPVRLPHARLQPEAARSRRAGRAPVAAHGGRAADIRIANLNAEVLGGLVKASARAASASTTAPARGRLDPRGYRPATHLEGLSRRLHWRLFKTEFHARPN